MRALDFVLNGGTGFIKIVSDLNKVAFCLEKIKRKNLVQNAENLRHFLMKYFTFDRDKDMKLIDEAIAANIVKSPIFNSKDSFRIIRVDSNADVTIIVPETQE